MGKKNGVLPRGTVDGFFCERAARLIIIVPGTRKKRRKEANGK